MLLLVLAVATALRLESAAVLRMSRMKATEISCGEDAISWPQRVNFNDEIQTVSAQSCAECLILDTDGTGCAGDCVWNGTASKCAAAEKKDCKSNVLKWVAVIIALLIVLIALLLLFYYCCKKKQKNNESTQAEAKEADKRSSLDRQRQVELAHEEAQQTHLNPPSISAPMRTSRPSSGAPIDPETDRRAVTLGNVETGLRVVRGRCWEYGDQDGDAGTVGIVRMRVNEPNWWMVAWPNTPAHAYYCGIDARDRCDLALAPDQGV